MLPTVRDGAPNNDIISDKMLHETKIHTQPRHKLPPRFCTKIQSYIRKDQKSGDYPNT